MGLTKETILLTTIMKDKLTGETTKMVRSLKNLANGQQAVTDRTYRLTDGQRKLEKSVKKTSKAVKRFHFEWLGVMFAGMALYRVFGGLIRTQMELWGIMELFGAAMTVVLLPLMEALTPLFLDLADALMNLSPEMKTALGIFILIGAVFGLILFVLGQVMLGVGSMAIAFGISGAGILASIAPIALALFGIILIVMGVYDIVKGRFEGIGLIITGIGAILLIFIGWWALIPIAVGIAVYAIISHWEGIKAFFERFWVAIKTGFGNMWDWVWDKAKWIWEKISGLWTNSPLGKLFGMAIGFGKGVLGSFQTGGIVPQTGPYTLHKGETVVPAGDNTMNSSPVFNINANVSSDYDVGRLANELSKYWAGDFERLSKSRGTM